MAIGFGAVLFDEPGWEVGSPRSEDVAAVVADRLLAKGTPLDRYRLERVSCHDRDGKRVREFDCDVLYEDLAGDGPAFNGPFFTTRQRFVVTLDADGHVVRVRRR